VLAISHPRQWFPLLSALPVLDTLTINFGSSTPHPKQRNQPTPPLTCFVLPTLSLLEFHGASKYLEVLATHIDAPLLDEFEITFSNQLIFDIPQTIWFFNHLESFRPSSLTLEFSLPYLAHIWFSFGTMGYGTWLWNIDSSKSLGWQALFTSIA
jgi:hypothetical protein